MGSMPVGAHQMSPAEMRGYSYTGADVTMQDLPTAGKTITKVNPGAMGYENPGPTDDQRGIEANTNRTNGSTVMVTGLTGPKLEGEM